MIGIYSAGAEVLSHSIAVALKSVYCISVRMFRSSHVGLNETIPVSTPTGTPTSGIDKQKQ